MQIAACSRHSKQAGTARSAGRAEHPIASLYTTTISQAFGEHGGIGGGVAAQARTTTGLSRCLVLSFFWIPSFYICLSQSVLSCAGTPGMLCSARKEARNISMSATLVSVFLSALYMSVRVANGSMAMVCQWSKTQRCEAKFGRSHQGWFHRPCNIKHATIIIHDYRDPLLTKHILTAQTLRRKA